MTSTVPTCPTEPPTLTLDGVPVAAPTPEPIPGGWRWHLGTTDGGEVDGVLCPGETEPTPIPRSVPFGADLALVWPR